MTRIVVAGGSGVLGALVCHEVRRLLPQAELVVAARRLDPARAIASATSRDDPAEAVALDATDPESIRHALQGVDAVIVALSQQEPHVQAVCLELGIACVDVTASATLTSEIIGLDARARAAGVALIAMAGLFPGLSGLLAGKAAAQLDHVERVDVALHQNTNANVGRSGIVDMLNIISSPVEHRGRVEPGFRRRLPGRRRLRLIDHAERQVLATEAGLARTSYWTGWNSAAFTLVIALLVRTRLLPRFAPRLAAFVRHDPTQPETVELEVWAHGTHAGHDTVLRRGLTATSDYGVTATVAVALTALVLEGEHTGAGAPSSFTTFDGLMSRMRSSAITLSSA